MERPATQLQKPAADADWQIRVEAIARTELSRSAFYEVRQVEPSVRERVLHLEGKVSSYYLKQMVQAVVMHRLEGVVVIENDVVVEQSASGP
jgi:ACT domain-containing protein